MSGQRASGGSTAGERRVLDEAGTVRAMTWVMAIMVFLTMLAAALGLATAGAAGGLDRQLSGRLTVQLTGGDVGRRQADAAALAGRLAAMPGVGQAAAVERERLAALLAPWLGSDGADPELPLPALIDVDLADARALPAVVAAVRAAHPDARVDRQAAWMSPVGGFMRTLTLLAGALVVVLATATAAVVVLAARAGLEAHRDTIEVMHMLGSTDTQLARLFQRRIAIDAAIGGTCGGVAALAVLAFLGARASALGSDLLGNVALAPIDWAVVALFPLGFVILGMAAARTSVRVALRRRL